MIPSNVVDLAQARRARNRAETRQPASDRRERAREVARVIHDARLKAEARGRGDVVRLPGPLDGDGGRAA